MIEMRWLVPVEGEKVLQYRQQVDFTMRAGQWDKVSIVESAIYQWSEWKNVPVVAERDPSYP
jgi:hypothetical protein